MSDPVAADVAACARLLGELVAEVRALRRQSGEPPEPSAADCAAVAALLPAIMAAVGTTTFNARELVAYATESPKGQALRRALELALGPIEPGTARRLGKLFKRSHGVVVDGLRVARVGADREGAVLMIAKLAETRADADP